jgi:Putative addiction module component
MSMAMEDLRRHLMDLPLEARAELAYEVLDSMADEDLELSADEAEAAWADEIRRRVEEIRNGGAVTDELAALLAELDRFDVEPAEEEADRDGPGFEPTVEEAWDEEIRYRVEEIRDGTAATYAAEDVFTALHLRFA